MFEFIGGLVIYFLIFKVLNHFYDKSKKFIKKILK